MSKSALHWFDLSINEAWNSSKLSCTFAALSFRGLSVLNCGFSPLKTGCLWGCLSSVSLNIKIIFNRAQKARWICWSKPIYCVIPLSSMLHWDTVGLTMAEALSQSSLRQNGCECGWIVLETVGNGDFTHVSSVAGCFLSTWRLLLWRAAIWHRKGGCVPGQWLPYGAIVLAFRLLLILLAAVSLRPPLQRVLVMWLLCWLPIGSNF